MTRITGCSRSAGARKALRQYARSAAAGGAACVLALCVAPGAVVAQDRDVKVSGMGVRKCKEWTAWKEEKNGQARAIALEWSQGFLAGHNIYAPSAGRAAGSVVADARILLPLFDAYCAKSPESSLLAVMIEITQSLGGARIRVAPKVPSPEPGKPARDS